MITQLSPSIPVVTPYGKGLAHFLINYGIETHLQWVVFLDNNGECWTFQNPEIRVQKNITHGRDYISPFYDPDDVKFPSSDKSCQDDQGHHCTRGEITCFRLPGEPDLILDSIRNPRINVDFCPFCGEKNG